MATLQESGLAKDKVRKECPQCGRSSDLSARICVCGAWFVEQTEMMQVSALRQVKKRTRSRNVKKASALAGFAIVFVGILAYLGGFIDLSRNSEPGHETLTAANVPLTVPAEKNTFAKNTFEGRVTGVISGDTIKVVDKYKQEYTIRLSGIDAPGPNQFFAEEAKNNLSALVLDKTVLVITQKIEDDGSVIGKVLIGGQNSSLEQVRAGFAAHAQSPESAQTNEDRMLYANAEQLAKKGGFGFWSSTNPGTASALPAEPDGGHSNQIRTLHGENITPQPPATMPTPGQETAVVESQKVLQEKSVKSTPAAAEPAASAPAETIANQPQPVVTNPAESQPKVSPTTRKYTLGPRGGCYYVNSKGNKSYVDKSLCN